LVQVSLAVYLQSIKFYKYGMTCRTTAKKKAVVKQTHFHIRL